jgi:hypothetical protein
MPSGGTGIDPVFQGGIANTLALGPAGQAGYWSAGASGGIDGWGVFNPIVLANPGAGGQVDDTFGIALDLESLPGVVGSKNYISIGTATDLIWEGQWNPVWRMKFALRRTTTIRFFGGWFGADIDSILDASDTGRPQVAFRYDTGAGDATLQFDIGDAAMRTYVPSTVAPVADVPLFLYIFTDDAGVSYRLEIRDEDNVLLDSHEFTAPTLMPAPGSTLIFGAGCNELSALAPSAATTRIYYSGVVHRV